MGDSAHTTHHTDPGGKPAPPLFLEDENFFQKSATLVLILLKFRIEPTCPIFEKSSHLREKGGVLMLFKTTLHLGAKAEYRSYRPTGHLGSQQGATKSDAPNPVHVRTKFAVTFQIFVFRS